MHEIWKDIKGYAGLYQVSNFGRVKSLKVTTNYNGKSYTKSERILKFGVRPTGYLSVHLHSTNGGKTYLVHRLVAETFIPNPNDELFDCINHKDENKQNNCVNNLEWCTRAYNDNYGTRNNKLRNAQLGKSMPDETKHKISEKLKGENNPFYGKHHSYETRTKISNTVKEQYENGRINPMTGVHRYGENAPRYGATLSEETKQKISKSLKERNKGGVVNG